MHPSKIQLALLVAALLTGAANAETKFGDHVTLKGFGTIGAVVTDTNEAQLRRTANQASGADKDVDFGVDSRLGMQATAKWNDIFSLTGQVLVERSAYKPANLEWLYGEAKLPAGFTVKLGRMVLPTFMVSDSRSVGYAAHWLRAPQEVYAVYPVSSFDGGQLMARHAFGPVNLTAQVSLGSTKTKIGLYGRIGELKVDDIQSVNLLMESGDWLVRLGRTSADATFNGVPLPALTDHFTGLGVQYDNGKAIVMAEYVTRRVDSAVGGVIDSDMWYASAGWRFGSLTPYVTASKRKPTGSNASRITDSTSAIGLRWDAMNDIAVKAQWQRTKGSVMFVNATPAFAATAPGVNALSLAVDFVF